MDDIAGDAKPAYALAAQLYLKPEIFAREREWIFFRTWQYACHQSEVPKTGDYLAFRVIDQGLFVIRDREGKLRAFYNVCQHRAHELLQGRGHVAAITCPYHAWTYRTDGTLRSARNAEKVPGFDSARICLTEVKLEVLCGFVFVNLDPDAQPMADWYPGVAEELRRFLPGIAEMRHCHDVAVEEHCNWKVTVENYNECYHCRVAHPTFAKGVIDPASYNVVPQGHCLRHTTRAAKRDAMTYDIEPRRTAGSADYSSWFLWPAFSFQVYPGGVLNTYLWRPVSPGETLVYRGWFLHEGEDPAPIRKLAQQDRNTTVAEDIAIVQAVQRGLASQGYRPGPLILDPNGGVNSEHSVQILNGWLREALREESGIA